MGTDHLRTPCGKIVYLVCMPVLLLTLLLTPVLPERYIDFLIAPAVICGLLVVIYTLRYVVTLPECESEETNDEGSS